jgi:PPOX class probable F420-dependent enzyme
MAALSDDIRALFEGPNFGHLATVMPDGSPHTVPVWVGLEGERVAFFTQEGSQKAKNLERDARCAISITDYEQPYRSARVRGRVVEKLTAGCRARGHGPDRPPLHRRGLSDAVWNRFRRRAGARWLHRAAVSPHSACLTARSGTHASRFFS